MKLTDDLVYFRICNRRLRPRVLRQTSLMRSQAIVNDITAHIVMLTELILENVSDPGRVSPSVRKLGLYHDSGVRCSCPLIWCDLAGFARSFTSDGFTSDVRAI